MSALRAAGRHEEMKRFPLTLPQLGSTYPFEIDGRSELFTVDRIDLGQGLMYLESCERTFERAMFVNDVVRMVRPNDAAAWLPVLREHYTMDDEGRAALIAEANAPRTVTEDLAWVDSLECTERGPYTPMGPVCHNGEDFARAFPSLTSAVTDDLSHDIYATIGDSVPPLVWPRQESEQSPARSETPDAIVMTRAEPGMPHVMRVENFNVGDRVIVVKKVETLSNGRSAGWESQWMDETVGETGHVVDASYGRVLVHLDSDGCEWAYAPEALALENACSEVTERDDAPVVDGAPVKSHVFKPGERVVVARKVERDSTGHWCYWPKYHAVLGLSGVITSIESGPGATVFVDLADGGQHGLSPEALDLMTVAQRPLKPGDKVRVARKVVTDSKGRDCDWDDFNMAQTIGTELVVSHVESAGDRDSIPVRLANGYWYSPEALDLIEPAP